MSPEQSDASSSALDPSISSLAVQVGFGNIGEPFIAEVSEEGSVYPLSSLSLARNISDNQSSDASNVPIGLGVRDYASQNSTQPMSTIFGSKYNTYSIFSSFDDDEDAASPCQDPSLASASVAAFSSSSLSDEADCPALNFHSVALTTQLSIIQMMMIVIVLWMSVRQHLARIHRLIPKCSKKLLQCRISNRTSLKYFLHHFAIQVRIREMIGTIKILAYGTIFSWNIQVGSIRAK